MKTRLCFLLLWVSLLPCYAQMKEFPMVTIPSALASPEERTHYLVEHYWDKFDFKDSGFIDRPEATEQAFANYIDLMRLVTPEKGESAIRQMLQQASADSTVFVHFTYLYEKYLYDIDSPLRNEALYIPVLDYILSSPLLDEIDKVRPAYQLEMAKKNRVGEQAADFTYTLADGKSGRLYELVADYLLLFFYNPDCDECKAVRERLTLSPLVTYWREKKGLEVLAFYPDGDLEMWRHYIPQIPADWINSYDATQHVFNDELYDLKATPTLYLLDKEKRVLLKDAMLDQLMNYLDTHLMK